MKQIHVPFRNSMIIRLTVLVGLVLLISISIMGVINDRQLKRNMFKKVVNEMDRLAETIKLGAHYAMMINSREDIDEIIRNIGRQEQIISIRIYNKEGEIKYSTVKGEIDRKTDQASETCRICHLSKPPLTSVEIAERTRQFETPEKGRMMGVISPIYNEPGCSTGGCHIHPKDKTVLGALDVVVSLKETDDQIYSHERQIMLLALFSFLSTAGIIIIYLLFYVIRPVNKLISWTQLIGRGEYDFERTPDWGDEMGHLADAITRMGGKIQEKQEEVNRQRNEYQQLFEQVPCYITVVDRDFNLLRYNRAFDRQFFPRKGELCFQVYKGRTEPCEHCPVMETFADGQSHYSEEAGVSKDGVTSYWLVQTSPIKDDDGNTYAVMEMCLDITIRKQLEKAIHKSQANYRMIFNNIPNPVFVLDARTLTVLDCNEVQTGVYGYSKKDLLNKPFTDLFDRQYRESYAVQMRTEALIDQVRHFTRTGKLIFVNIRISPFEYMGKDALLVTTSDITQKLMMEQQLIQAGKMTTLGEMATGIAHELNQPLTVIKTASSFLMRKVRKEERIDDEILKAMTEEINNHVNRASKIINHLREFGRKSDVKKEPVRLEEPLNKAVEMFSQQLKLREIEVIRKYGADLPPILADANRLEQVFVNLLINARDAIEEKWEAFDIVYEKKQITIQTARENGQIILKLADNGAGIPPYSKDRIFEPFFTTKKVGKGTGLGLSISYGIIQDYEGDISVESEEGKGAEFIIRFPAVMEEDAEADDAVMDSPEKAYG